MKSEKVDMGNAALSGVKVVRWWRSKELWNYIASTVLIVGPLLANGLGALGLEPLQLLIWTVAVAVGNHVAGIVFRMTSTSVIGNKSDVTTAKKTVALYDDPDNENVGASDVR
jgi:hypothetical protein